MPASGVVVGTLWRTKQQNVKDQATERYGVVPKEMTDGVAKVNKEYKMLVLSYDSS